MKYNTTRKKSEAHLEYFFKVCRGIANTIGFANTLHVVYRVETIAKDARFYQLTVLLQLET